MNGVFVVLVFQPGQGCDLEKNITITVLDTLPLDEYASRVANMMSWFLAPAIVYLVLLAVERFRQRGFSFNEPELHENEQAQMAVHEDGDPEGHVGVSWEKGGRGGGAQQWHKHTRHNQLINMCWVIVCCH